MNFHKKQKPLISLVCTISLILSMVIVPVAAADTNRVTATTSEAVTQGDSAYCYINIDSTEGLAAIDVTVHYDPAKVKITSTFNSVSCTLYDSVINTDSIQFNYILDGQGTASKTRLFYFRYQVLSNADVGDAYFDITIGEAYDNSLNEVAVSGSCCNFTVTEKATSKSCSVYSSGSIKTAIDQEFTLSYHFSTYQIASGMAVISYDAELFEVANVTSGAFLANKVVDINTNLTGEIYISFVGTEYDSNTDLVSVTFRTIQNVTETSKITFKVTELLDQGLDAYSCSGYTTNVSVAYDEMQKGDSPAMRLDASISYDDMQLTLVVSLDANSKLGAGDFVITFDPTLATYRSCTKGFTPSFFNINDKNVDSGELKFHIISLSDIVTEETVLTVVFDLKSCQADEKMEFELSGTEFTDSLTNRIQLDLVGTSVSMAYNVEHRYYDNGQEITVGYATLEEALAAANRGTVKLLTDTAAGNVVLKPGIILDLNGHNLVADLAVAMNGATVLDSKSCGLLKIAKRNLALAEDNGNVIPVWNGVDGYLFTKVTFQQMAKAAGAGAAQYIFLPTFSNAQAAALLADGGADNGFKMKVSLVWGNGQSQQFYTYGDDLVAQVFASNGRLVFSLTVTGISGIADMTASAVIVTDSGTQACAVGTVLVAE